MPWRRRRWKVHLLFFSTSPSEQNECRSSKQWKEKVQLIIIGFCKLRIFFLLLSSFSHSLSFRFYHVAAYTFDSVRFIQLFYGCHINSSSSRTDEFHLMIILLFTMSDMMMVLCIRLICVFTSLISMLSFSRIRFTDWIGSSNACRSSKKVSIMDSSSRHRMEKRENSSTKSDVLVIIHSADPLDILRWVLSQFFSQFFIIVSRPLDGVF